MAKDAFVLSVEGGVAVKAADAGDLGGRGPVPQKSLGIEGALFADVLLETDAEVLAKAMNDPGGADKVACGERSCRVLLGGMLVDVVQNDLQGLVVTDGLNRLGAFAVAEKEQERVAGRISIREKLAEKKAAIEHKDKAQQKDQDKKTQREM